MYNNVYTLCLSYMYLCDKRCRVYASAWGFCVARFDYLGSAKASTRGASNDRLHALFFVHN